LTGGTGELAKFVGHYEKMAKKFPIWSPTNPVIILTDNDSGGRKKSNKNAASAVFSAVSQNYWKHANPNVEDDSDFYYVVNNLYLVKTPHIGDKKETCIEDLFDKSLFDYKINGKTFDPENDADKNKFYGKRYFAEKVISKNFETINFDGFNKLLNRLQFAINDYRLEP